MKMNFDHSFEKIRFHCKSIFIFSKLSCKKILFAFVLFIFTLWNVFADARRIFPLIEECVTVVWNNCWNNVEQWTDKDSNSLINESAPKNDIAISTKNVTFNQNSFDRTCGSKVAYVGRNRFCYVISH